MINDYTGKVLHAAHYQDLMNEAKGGWLLRQAKGDRSTSGRPKAARRVLSVLLIIIVLAVGVLRFAA